MFSWVFFGSPVAPSIASLVSRLFQPKTRTALKRALENMNAKTSSDIFQILSSHFDRNSSKGVMDCAVRCQVSADSAKTVVLPT